MTMEELVQEAPTQEKDVLQMALGVEFEDPDFAYLKEEEM